MSTMKNEIAQKIGRKAIAFVAGGRFTTHEEAMQAIASGTRNEILRRQVLRSGHPMPEKDSVIWGVCEDILHRPDADTTRTAAATAVAV